MLLATSAAVGPTLVGAHHTMGPRSTLLVGAALLGGVRAPDDVTKAVIDAVEQVVFRRPARTYEWLVAAPPGDQLVLLAAVGAAAKARIDAAFVSAHVPGAPRPRSGRLEHLDAQWRGACELGFYALTSEPAVLCGLGDVLEEAAEYRFASRAHAGVALSDFVRWAVLPALRWNCDPLECFPLECWSDRLGLEGSTLGADPTLADPAPVPSGRWDEASRAALVETCRTAIAKAFEAYPEGITYDANRERSFVERAAKRLLAELGDEAAFEMATTVAPEVIEDYQPDPDKDNTPNQRVRAMFETIRRMARAPRR